MSSATATDELIRRHEDRYGFLAPSRIARQIVGGRATLDRAIAKGLLVPVGRRGGGGERMFRVSDCVRFVLGVMEGASQPAPRIPPPPRVRATAGREVGAALAELERIGGAK